MELVGVEAAMLARETSPAETIRLQISLEGTTRETDNQDNPQTNLAGIITLAREDPDEITMDVRANQMEQTQGEYRVRQTDKRDNLLPAHQEEEIIRLPIREEITRAEEITREYALL